MIAKLAQLFIQRRASIPRSEALRTLGFSPTEDPNLSEITTAWKKAVMKHHPDRGGDLGTMQLVNLSYDILKGKTRAAPEPSGSAQKSSPSGRSWYSGPTQTPPERDRNVSFESVVPTPPTGIEWVFVTERLYAPVKAFSDSSEETVWGFSLVGRTSDYAYLWAFVHREFLPGSSHGGTTNVWTLNNHRVPVSQFGTPQFERLVKDHLNSAISAQASYPPKLSRIRGAYPASELKDRFTFIDIARITIGKPQPIARFLRPDATSKAPPTTIVKLQWNADPIYNFQELIVIVNSDRFPLSEEDTRKLEYSGFLNKVFGSYYYSGDVKLVNRLKNRSQVYMTLAKMDSLPRNIQVLLLNLA